MNMCILCENVTQFCLFINFEKNFNNISGSFLIIIIYSASFVTVKLTSFPSL